MINAHVLCTTAETLDLVARALNLVDHGKVTSTLTLSWDLEIRLSRWNDGESMTVGFWVSIKVL